MESMNVPMSKLKREDLYSLEQYAQMRPQFRAMVMKHKKNRQIAIGAHASLSFEDRLTMHYQVQEMLRVERIFELGGIEEELAAYNPLIPDGTNWKATFMLEYPDIEQRRQALAHLKGVEKCVWIRVATCEPVLAIADEDLERENDEKTSSVHFLRFELTPNMIAAAKNGAVLSVGIDHPVYRFDVDPLPSPIRDSLVADLLG